MRARHLIILAAGLLTVSSLLASAHFVNADSGTLSTATAILPTTFRDSSGVPELAIQLQAGRPDTGQFDFYVAGIGHYEGIIAPRTSSDSLDHLQGSVSAEFFTDGASQQTPTSVRMEGIVDPTNLRANVNVWAGGTHYHLQTDQGSAGTAAPIVQKVTTALQAEDWATLYTLLASDMQNQFTQAQFVQLMAGEASAPQQPSLTSVVATGSGQIVSSPLGYTYY